MIRKFALTTAATLLLATAFAGSADARPRAFTAQLTQPVAERVEFIAEGAVWRCEGDACRATVANTASVAGCRDVVRRVGAVASYGPETAPFNADRLTRCNAVAPQTAAAPAPEAVAESAPEAAPVTEAVAAQ